MKSKKTPVIYWSWLNINEWNLYLGATEKGLCFVGSQAKPIEELSEWAKRRLPGSVLKEDNKTLEPYAKELLEYLNGHRQHFTIPYDYQGTDFQNAVWETLCNIPFGETKSYSEIAEAIGKPSAVRAVGAAIGANPVLIGVPCHRVVGKNGQLTGYRGGIEMKAKLLQLESQKPTEKV